MSIVSGELICYSAASIPEDDTSTSGGAIDTATRPGLTQWSANAVAAAISDGADTRTLTITGRLASGVIDTEILTLTGAVEVVGAKTWERVLKAVLSTTSGSRTVSLKQGSGGTTRATLGPNETKTHIFFQQSASAGSQLKRYEKLHWKNTNGSLALTSAQVTLTADPSSKIKIGVAATTGDSGTVANRLAAPGGISFVDDSVAQSVPGGSLASGANIGVWLEQTLGANDPAVKSTFTTQLSGQTT